MPRWVQFFLTMFFSLFTKFFSKQCTRSFARMRARRAALGTIFLQRFFLNNLPHVSRGGCEQEEHGCHFSKVLFKVTLYSKFTWALTFQNFCQRREPKEQRRQQVDSSSTVTRTKGGGKYTGRERKSEITGPRRMMKLVRTKDLVENFVKNCRL